MFAQAALWYYTNHGYDELLESLDFAAYVVFVAASNNHNDSALAQLHTEWLTQCQLTSA